MTDTNTSSSTASSTPTTNLTRDAVLQLASSSARVVDWDDGHVPENTQGMATKLVRYDDFLDRPPVVHVVDDSVPQALIDALYRVTVKEGKPWGTYVTVKEAMEQQQCSSNTTTTIEDDKEALAKSVASLFLKNALGVSNGSIEAEKKVTTHAHSSSSSTSTTPLWTPTDHSARAHGVAVWALASTVRSQVAYHLDYAEQIRYEHNLIVPPLLAGTLQCTKTPLEGGEFAVHMGGLEHYQDFGYKGAKKGSIDDLDYSTTTQESSSSNDWITIPYACNRMILSSGHLPHLSRPVLALQDETQKRVIVGFNVFGHDYGALVQAAPEHSDTFRRKVQLTRALQQSLPKNGGANSRITLEALKANKGLAKLLVLAKREKVKQEMVAAQRILDERLEEIVVQSGNGGVSVESLMKQLASTEGTFPLSTDVQVHINQRLKKDATTTEGGNEENTRQRQGSHRLCLKEPSKESHRMVQPLDVVYLWSSTA